jgi:adenylate kinase
MQMVIMGPPGAGKGTQAAVLTEKLGIPHISTGDMFRKAMKENTPLGMKATAYIEKGQLVPDTVTIDLIRERLSESDCLKGFLLDGFPRTVEQAEALNLMMKDRNTQIDVVLSVEVPAEALLDRLTGRRTCPVCGATYHVKNKPPIVEGKCDRCSGTLQQRSDDTEETVMKRLKVYEAETRPLVEYYEHINLIQHINGNQSMDAVLNEIAQAIGRDIS